MTRGRYARSDWAELLFIIWAAASLWSETRQLIKERSLQSYWSDRFNRIDMPAAICSLAALACMHIDLRAISSSPLASAFSPALTINPLAAGLDAPPLTPATRCVRAFAVLLLWLRVPRLFLLSTRGPLVLMLFQMVNDVLGFLLLLGSVLLSFAAAYLVRAPPPPPPLTPWEPTLTPAP